VIIMAHGCTAIAIALAAAAFSAATPDRPFDQDYHERLAGAENVAANDVRSIGVDPSGTVWIAARGGIFRQPTGSAVWDPAIDQPQQGPAYAVCVDPRGTVWIGAYNGLYRATAKGIEKITGISKPVTALCTDHATIMAAGPDGLWRIDGGRTVYRPLPCAQGVRAILADRQGGLWLATDMGLHHHTMDTDTTIRDARRVASARVRDMAYAPDGTLWVVALGGVTAWHPDGTVTQHRPHNGLPSSDARCVACDSRGRVWVGTAAGVARYDGSTWSVRNSRRWLASDDVRDLWIDADGTAWVATSAGVSAIHRRTMTLSEKADHYLATCYQRHVRPPGLVENCRLEVPGNLETWHPNDDDNDGQYTSMYLAMESFRYAATHDPRAERRARGTFDALQFLQTVTGTPGFVARTVVPADWKQVHDPNRTITDREWTDRRVRDPRDKRVPVRWHASKDGKWRWKGDTSSDEITGHYYGVLMYYDLVADANEQQRVADHVRKITDYIIDHGFVLEGIDGQATRWGVWSPEKLNGDPNWESEQPINSLEILSYLKAAWHMTGDARYQRHYRRLIDEHHFAENARRAKTMVRGWRTHISDELLALTFPALLMYETDPRLRSIYMESLGAWYATVRADGSPYFNFTVSWLTGRDVDRQTSLVFLRAMPLDLVRWQVDNRRREDLRMTRLPELGPLQTDRLVPPSERGVIRWDKNPWLAVQGDGGRTESAGVFWLLPYWMGRYCGFIAAR